MVHIKKKEKKSEKESSGLEWRVCVCVCVYVCKTDSTRFENVRKQNTARAYGDISTYISHPL